MREKNEVVLHDSASTICNVSPGTLDVEAVRKNFPIIRKRGASIFFDNASTTQKPESVIRCISQFYRNECANAGRAAYSMSTKLKSRIESARATVASFIGASPENICFTSGATESLNTVAMSWGLRNLRDGDEVMVCLDDHKSTVLPWPNLQQLLQNFGIQIKIVPIALHAEGDYELKSIRAGLSSKTRLLALTHVHHVFGLDMEVGEIRKIVGPDVLISLDASQSVGHRKVDVNTLDVDFLSFSGHKMFAAFGVGVLYVRTSLLTSMKPTLVGGGQSTEVATITGGQKQAARIQNAASLEAGTQDIPAILSMVPAIHFIEKTGIENIEGYISNLTRHLYFKLKELPGVEFSPGIDRTSCLNGFGIVSFRFEQARTSDVAFLLADELIFVRSGDHCLSQQQDGDEYMRVSLHVYNTEEEVDQLVALLEENLS